MQCKSYFTLIFTITELLYLIGFHFMMQYQQSNIANVFPRPTSLKLFCHGMQNWYSGNLHHFNYGRAENFKRYGTPMPPEYLVENVKIPVAIFYSNGDELCTPKVRR
jgi:hypothetical protein